MAGVQIWPNHVLKHRHFSDSCLVFFAFSIVLFTAIHFCGHEPPIYIHRSIKLIKNCTSKHIHPSTVTAKLRIHIKVNKQETSKPHEPLSQSVYQI